MEARRVKTAGTGDWPVTAADPQPAYLSASECLIDVLLPDELLGSVFTLLGRSAGPTVSLVNRRWYRVLYSPDASGFWGDYTIDSSVLIRKLVRQPQAQREWARHKLAQLCRVGPCISSFFLRDTHGALAATAAAASSGTPWQLSHALDFLSPSALTSVGLANTPLTESSLAAAELARLSRFAALRSLQLISVHLPDGHAGQLSALGTLRTLRCRVGVLPHAFLPAVAQLSNLTCLELESITPAPGDLGQLSRLPRLARLKIEAAEAGAAGALAAPCPVDFPALQAFELGCPKGVQVGSAVLLSCSFLAGPPPIGDPLAAPAGQLCLVGISQLKSLATLLGALLPGGARLDCLHLERCQLAPSALSTPCPALKQVKAMRVHYLQQGSPLETAGAALGPLLRQADGTTALELYGRVGHPLPDGLAAMAGLRWLRLRQNYLEDLPAGPYLQALTYLDFGDNNCAQFKQLPLALASCASLEHLDLSKNSKILVRLVDTDILLAMPALRRLTLSGTPSARTLLHLRSAALQDLEIVQHGAA